MLKLMSVIKCVSCHPTVRNCDVIFIGFGLLATFHTISVACYLIKKQTNKKEFRVIEN